MHSFVCVHRIKMSKFVSLVYQTVQENKAGEYTANVSDANIKNPEGRISVVLTDGATPTLQQSIALLFSRVFIASSPNLASFSPPCAERTVFSHAKL